MSKLNIKTLVLASKNKGKIAELQALLEPFNIEIKSALDFDLPDVVEDGQTFADNAIKKALEVMQATGLPTLADDSGLCVDALDGGPGVHTARYDRGYGRLLNALEHELDSRRQAYFFCSLALAHPEPGCVIGIFEGQAEGTITTFPRGEGGFGYDPVFMPEGYEQTFAEMGAEAKGQVSHRGLALQKLITFLAENRG